MKITCITAACHRSEAWALSEGYMRAQTRQPDQWLVLDGGEPSTCTMGQEYHHWEDLTGQGSMTGKIRRAIEQNLIKGDILVFWENDDWMAPAWLSFCEQQLVRYDLIGEGRNLYYNVRDRWWFEHANMQHASLCATAMSKRVIPQLLRECTKVSDPWIDDRLWKNCRMAKKVFDPHATKKRLTIGIKAMPGLAGYGSGHDRTSGWAIRDPSMGRLKQLIGADADAYEKFYEPPIPAKVIPQAITLPLIEVRIVAYNEEGIMPYTLRHYKTFASRIIVHDAGSTDRTREICKEYGVDVVDWDTAGKINDELLRILKETCWNGTDAKWVIMVDADELVHFPGGVAATLTAYDKQQVPAVKCKGFEMESPTYPDTMGQIYEQVNHGAPDDRWYGKPCLLSPERIQSIHFTHGAHECIVTTKRGQRVQSPRVNHHPPTYLLHYKHIGSVQRVGDRYDGNKSRFSEVNIKHGWGWAGEGLTHAIQKRAEILTNRKKVL